MKMKQATRGTEVQLANSFMEDSRWRPRSPWKQNRKKTDVNGEVTPRPPRFVAVSKSAREPRETL